MFSKLTLKDFGKVFAFSIVLYVSFAVILQGIPNFDRVISEFHPAVAFIISYSMQLLILFIPLWYFISHKHKIKFKDFGFTKVKPLTLIITVAGSYIAYMILITLISLFLFANQLDIPGYEAQESYMPIFGSDPIGFGIAIFFIVLIAPIIEELYFRGFIYRLFRKTWSVWIGSIATAAFFAMIHFQFNSFIPLFILGLFINFVYQRTGSVWTAVAFHMLNNGIAFGLEIYLTNHPELLEETTALLYNLLRLA